VTGSGKRIISFEPRTFYKICGLQYIWLVSAQAALGCSFSIRGNSPHRFLPFLSERDLPRAATAQHAELAAPLFIFNQLPQHISERLPRNGTGAMGECPALAAVSCICPR